ncbi:putative membrane protein [Propionispora sp. 2/2-37]|uniref:hypothetical protein n=1 Tax=Propionispora sp. 2/2-37 TaxID=1677858 RepID=UPI0006BB6169|nr:hypothetical protein [Propionispora sp. 2/2-37]CUH97400.1 putative membrane protein [Propionispora sp. 2/2-37]
MSDYNKRSKKLTKNKRASQNYTPIVIKGEWIETIQKIAIGFQVLRQNVQRIVEQIGQSLSQIITPELIEFLMIYIIVSFACIESLIFLSMEKLETLQIG